MTARVEPPNPPDCRCAECGMPLDSWVEYHPIEACRLFQECGDAERVRRIVRQERTDV